MKQSKQFYVVVNDDNRDGVIVENKEELKQFKKPITFQTFPEHLKNQMRIVLEQEAKRIKKMH